MSVFVKIWYFYRDGFREMSVGRSLWLLIAIKLFVMFAILKLFFFRGTLSHLDTDDQKSQFVTRELIDRLPHE